MKAILLKLTTTTVNSDGIVTGFLHIADASATLQRPYIYESLDELRADDRPARVWRCLSSAQRLSNALAPGLYAMGMRWARRTQNYKPSVIVPSEKGERVVMLRVKNTGREEQPERGDLLLTEMFGRSVLRRIASTMRTGCEVYLRVE